MMNVFRVNAAVSAVCLFFVFFCSSSSLFSLLLLLFSLFFFFFFFFFESSFLLGFFYSCKSWHSPEFLVWKDCTLSLLTVSLLPLGLLLCFQHNQPRSNNALISNRYYSPIWNLYQDLTDTRRSKQLMSGPPTGILPPVPPQHHLHHQELVLFRQRRRST